MKNNFSILLFTFLSFCSHAQNSDSIASNCQKPKTLYKKLIIPTALITAGGLLLNSQINRNIQQDVRQITGNDFHTSIDDYIQYTPILQIYAGKQLGFKPKNNITHQTIQLLVANVVMGGIVQTMKYTFKEPRPDNSNTQSFPSGHTALAFTNATLLFQEYKDSNIWYASSGFLFATATGLLRVANNKHYASDVLTGAGIGMASAFIVSYLNPLKSFEIGKNKKTTALVYPQIGNHLGIGILVPF